MKSRGPGRKRFQFWDRPREFQLDILIAASAVIFSHSFLLADGDEVREPFARFSATRTSLACTASSRSFIVRGFLITQSPQEPL
jgi:hypothetical protein